MQEEVTSEKAKLLPILFFENSSKLRMPCGIVFTTFPLILGRAVM